jgi:hypothetical protein
VDLLADDLEQLGLPVLRVKRRHLRRRRRLRSSALRENCGENRLNG